mmetsp:Transcript_13720/g.34444  ORF Transcript_13720/g.34444 Transcript_13720/m.34444 type:complete len:213 (+) Transcript_13720:785-1423(+)
MRQRAIGLGSLTHLRSQGHHRNWYGVASDAGSAAGGGSGGGGSCGSRRATAVPPCGGRRSLPVGCLTRGSGSGGGGQDPNCRGGTNITYSGLLRQWRRMESCLRLPVQLPSARNEAQAPAAAPAAAAPQGRRRRAVRVAVLPDGVAVGRLLVGDVCSAAVLQNVASRTREGTSRPRANCPHPRQVVARFPLSPRQPPLPPSVEVFRLLYGRQ